MTQKVTRLQGELNSHYENSKEKLGENSELLKKAVDILGNVGYSHLKRTEKIKPIYNLLNEPQKNCFDQLLRINQTYVKKTSRTREIKKSHEVRENIYTIRKDIRGSRLEKNVDSLNLNKEDNKEVQYIPIQNYLNRKPQQKTSYWQRAASTLVKTIVPIGIAAALAIAAIIGDYSGKKSQQPIIKQKQAVINSQNKIIDNYKTEVNRLEYELTKAERPDAKVRKEARIGPVISPVIDLNFIKKEYWAHPILINDPLPSKEKAVNPVMAMLGAENNLGAENKKIKRLVDPNYKFNDYGKYLGKRADIYLKNRQIIEWGFTGLGSWLSLGNECLGRVAEVGAKPIGGVCRTIEHGRLLEKSAAFFGMKGPYEEVKRKDDPNENAWKKGAKDAEEINDWFWRNVGPVAPFFFNSGPNYNATHANALNWLSGGFLGENRGMLKFDTKDDPYIIEDGFPGLLIQLGSDGSWFIWGHNNHHGHHGKGASKGGHHGNGPNGGIERVGG